MKDLICNGDCASCLDHQREESRGVNLLWAMLVSLLLWAILVGFCLIGREYVSHVKVPTQARSAR